MRRVRDHYWLEEIEGDENLPPGWYFDTPFEDFEGPYNTLEECEKAFERFCSWLDGPEEDDNGQD